MENIINIIIYKDTIFIILFVLILLFQIYRSYKFYKYKNKKWGNIIIQFLKNFLYGIQLFVLLFFIVILLLNLISPEYRAGGTSGPGMGPAFSHGVILAISIFFILPFTVLGLGILFLIQKYLNKYKPD